MLLFDGESYENNINWKEESPYLTTTISPTYLDAIASEDQCCSQLGWGSADDGTSSSLGRCYALLLHVHHNVSCKRSLSAFVSAYIVLTSLLAAFRLHNRRRGGVRGRTPEGDRLYSPTFGLASAVILISTYTDKSPQALIVGCIVKVIHSTAWCSGITSDSDLQGILVTSVRSWARSVNTLPSTIKVEWEIRFCNFAFKLPFCKAVFRYISSNTVAG